ncbi:hypothetical protein D6C88_09941, partial [Aureobasidium pullulans]
MPSDVDILSFAHNLRLYSFIKIMVGAVTLITVYDRPLGTWTVRPLYRRSTSQFEALTPDETTNPPTKDIADKIKKDKAFPDRGNDLFEAAGGSSHVHHNQQDPQIKGEPATDQGTSDRSQAQRRSVARLLIKIELDLSKPTTNVTRPTTAMYLPPYDIKAIVAFILNSLDISHSTSEVCGDEGEQKEEAQFMEAELKDIPIEDLDPRWAAFDAPLKNSTRTNG